MHSIIIHLLTLILIQLIYFLIKTLLIYSIYIINIICFIDLFGLCPLYVTSKQLIPARQLILVSLFCYFIIFNLILLYMDLLTHNIQRITEWIHAELDYNCLTPRYSNAF